MELHVRKAYHVDDPLFPPRWRLRLHQRLDVLGDKIRCLRGRGVDGPVRERARRQHRAQQQLADRQSQRAQRLLRALPPCPSHARSSPNGATCPCRHSQGTRHLVYKAIEQMKRSLELRARPTRLCTSPWLASSPGDAIPARNCSSRWRSLARLPRRLRRCACAHEPAENRERGSRAAHARRPAFVGRAGSDRSRTDPRDQCRPGSLPRRPAWPTTSNASLVALIPSSSLTNVSLSLTLRQR